MEVSTFSYIYYVNKRYVMIVNKPKKRNEKIEIDLTKRYVIKETKNKRKN